MDSTFHGASYFYFVPVVIFLPIMLVVLWNFGLKDLFRRSDAEKRELRLEQIRADKESKRRLEKAGGLAVRAVHEPPQSVASWIGRTVAYASFAAVLGTFSAWPPYVYWPDDAGQLKLSISIPGVHKDACQKRSREELMKLPPNMRAPVKCTRERLPVVVETLLDGNPLYSGLSQPAGLSKDGASSFYQKFAVPVGKHVIGVRLSLDGGASFPYALNAPMDIAAGQVIVIGIGGSDKALYLR